MFVWMYQGGWVVWVAVAAVLVVLYFILVTVWNTADIKNELSGRKHTYEIKALQRRMQESTDDTHMEEFGSIEWKPTDKDVVKSLAQYTYEGAGADVNDITESAEEYLKSEAEHKNELFGVDDEEGTNILEGEIGAAKGALEGAEQGIQAGEAVIVEDAQEGVEDMGEDAEKPIEDAGKSDEGIHAYKVPSLNLVSLRDGGETDLLGEEDSSEDDEETNLLDDEVDLKADEGGFQFSSTEVKSVESSLDEVESGDGDTSNLSPKVKSAEEDSPTNILNA